MLYFNYTAYFENKKVLFVAKTGFFEPYLFLLQWYKQRNDGWNFMEIEKWFEYFENIYRNDYLYIFNIGAHHHRRTRVRLCEINDRGGNRG